MIRRSVVIIAAMVAVACLSSHAAGAERHARTLRSRSFDTELVKRALLRRMRGGSLGRSDQAAAQEQGKQKVADQARFRGLGDLSMDAVNGAARSAGKMAASTFKKRESFTVTDSEVCEGCKAMMEVVIRSTSEDASVRDIIFAIHSACNDQPEVFTEACMHATHYDANLAVLRQQNSDVAELCALGGMCLAAGA